jgi:hypothetical protein
MRFQIWFEIPNLRGRPVPQEAPVLDRIPDCCISAAKGLWCCSC